MSKRKQLELLPNQPKIIKLISDKPLIGKNSYGDYYMYVVKNGSDEELSFFAPNEIVHNRLKDLKKGTQLEITKTAQQNGKGITVDYEIVILEQKPSPKNSNDDFYYEAMEKSFADAIRIQNKFNGMANVNQLAVTIYISRLKQNPSFDGG